MQLSFWINIFQCAWHSNITNGIQPAFSTYQQLITKLFFFPRPQPPYAMMDNSCWYPSTDYKSTLSANSSSDLPLFSFSFLYCHVYKFNIKPCLFSASFPTDVGCLHWCWCNYRQAVWNEQFKHGAGNDLALLCTKLCACQRAHAACHGMSPNRDIPALQ